MIVIAPYTTDMASAVTALFHRSVHAIDPAIYTAAEKEAWAPTPPDFTHWAARLAHKQPHLALCDTQVFGFIELDPEGHIDCFYVDPDFQRCGVGTALLNHVERIARTHGICRLQVEASRAAWEFFTRMGFESLRENRIARQGQILVNYRMQKRL